MCKMRNLQIYEILQKYLYLQKAISMLEDFKLRIFLTLARECSFTKAALVLDITQPAVSQNIADLEKSLGTKLFERSRGEVALTPAGEIFKDYAESILDRYREASTLFTPLQEQQVSIAASEEVYTYIYNVLLKDFLKVHPEITVVRTTLDQADITVRSVPIDNKRGIFALSSDPSPYFAGTKTWKLLLHFLKPTL